MTRPQRSQNSKSRRRGAGWLALVMASVLSVVLRPGLSQEDAAPPAQPPLARVLQLDGAIGPAVADYLSREIATARELGADVIVLRMNTPGGLVTSMRSIVQAILGAPVPVLAYVAPQGAHAASAGTYLLYASHVAAMAPGTNLGAATPIEIGTPGLPGSPRPGPEDVPATPSPMPKKPATPDATPDAPGDDGGDDKDAVPSDPLAPPGAADLKAVNDMVAMIKGLAELRGRNAEWAERAVREAASLPAHEALALGVIDFMADDLTALLEQAHGRRVKLDGGEHTIRSAGARIDYAEIGWATRFLMHITDPNIAFLLMTLGMYGLIFELSNPGSVFPGLLGAICLLLALYALSVLPVNAVGVALIALGVLLMVAEAFTPTLGLLGVGGLVAFGLGATFLFDAEAPEFRVAWEVVIGTTAVTGAFMLGVIGYALNAQRRRVVAGPEDLIGRRATVTEWAGGQGFVHIEGERWQARSDELFTVGDQGLVTQIDGLVLTLAHIPSAKQ